MFFGLFHRRTDDAPREHFGCVTRIDRRGDGWIMCSMPRDHSRVKRRVVRRLGLVVGSRVEYDDRGDGWARRLIVVRRAHAA